MNRATCVRRAGDERRKSIRMSHSGTGAVRRGGPGLDSPGPGPPHSGVHIRPADEDCSLRGVIRRVGKDPSVSPGGVNRAAPTGRMGSRGRRRRIGAGPVGLAPLVASLSRTTRRRRPTTCTTTFPCTICCRVPGQWFCSAPRWPDLLWGWPVTSGTAGGVLRCWSHFLLRRPFSMRRCYRDLPVPDGKSQWSAQSSLCDRIRIRCHCRVLFLPARHRLWPRGYQSVSARGCGA